MKHLSVVIVLCSLFLHISLTPRAEAAVDTLVASNSVWKYFDLGTDLGTDWIAPNYDDSAWLSGPAQLGYGDGDEATVVNSGPPGAVFATTYFRQAFDVSNPAQYAVLSMRVQRDDGVIVYLNGQEIFRNNLANEGVAFDTYALNSAGDDGRGWLTGIINVPLNLLVNGQNVFAAEIHQQSPGSSDITFALELTGNTENSAPTIGIVSPGNDASFTEPATIAISATAGDTDGTVTLVEFYQGNTKLGEDAGAPFSYSWTGVPVGVYSLRGIATDNLGARATSAVVNVTVGLSTPPTITGKTPAPGSVTSLTSINTRFSEPVFGVDASDLLINGVAATAVSGSGSNYTFTFSQPAEGAIFVGWNGANGIGDFESPSKPFDPAGTAATWQYTLTDTTAPTATELSPPASSTIRELTSFEVKFSEPVVGVDASDLRVNGIAATTVTGRGNGPYKFNFPSPANGSVNLSWAAGHDITDLAAARNAFAGGTWSYTLSTNAVWEGNIVINEIMFHPTTEQIADEWIELHNRGASAVNLAGWRLNRAVDFVFPNVNLPAGGYLVVAASVPAFNALYPGVTAVVGGWTGRLSNSRDDIELEDATGNQIDLVSYADEGEWATRTLTGLGWEWNCLADGFGSSFELRQSALPNDVGQNWASSATFSGTPGAVNSVAAANVAPLIMDVTHFPAVPRSTNSITVLARLVDESAAGRTARLWYRDVTSGNLNAFASTPMLDNGASNDGAAGDGLFGVVIPPQANGTIIEFYVEAVDATSRTNTWPAAADIGGGTLVQEANALIQVDDEFYLGKQAIYRVVMRPNDRSDFMNGFDRVQRNASFISVEGDDVQIRHNCAVRRRGASSFGASPPTMKFDIPRDRVWNNKSSMNLNSVKTYAQVLGSAVALKAGLPSPYTRAVQLRFNGVNYAPSGGGMFGSYAHVEVFDGEWAGDHFPEDGNGNAYSKRRANCPVDSAGLEYWGPSGSDYVNCGYDKESNSSENDWSDLAALSFALDPDTTPDNAYVQAVRRNANVDQWMRYFAVSFLMNYNETALSNGADDDYDMYRGVNDPRFMILPHDFDSIFGSAGSTGNDLFLAARIPNLNRFLHHPDFEPLYYAEYRRQLAGAFSTNNLLPLFDQVLADWVPAGTINAMKANAISRIAYINSVLPPAPTTVLATVSGEPDSPTYLNTATLNVSGSDITHYRYRVNNGAWSAERQATQPISLSSLANGYYTVYVVGRNSGGTWQADAEATASRTWVVLSGLRGVVINEILARNDGVVNHEGTTPDYIEVYNNGTATIDLSGLRLTDDLDVPNRYVIPAGTTLAAGAYRVLFANAQDATSGLHIGFGIGADGDHLYLLDRATNGTRVIDSIKFGWQLSNLSIGRQPNGQWGLCSPTLGTANVSAAAGTTSTLRINEWMANPGGAFVTDFIELYNPDALPVNLGGLHLTDRPIGFPRQHRIAPLSFVDGFGYRVFIADGDDSAGPDHVNFSLSSEEGEIGLSSASGQLIDCVVYGQQFAGISQGRSPNGGPRVVYFDVPTPGAGNPVTAGPVQPQMITLIPINGTHAWRYDETGNDLGTAWYATGYDDSAWQSGYPVFAYDLGLNFLEPQRTPLTVQFGKITFYFRTKFTNAPGATISSLQATHLTDDAAVFYLNGIEAARFNLPAAPAPIDYLTTAPGSHEANVFETTTLSMASLLPGENILAVEVHQSSFDSSDIVFGMRLDALIITNNPALAGIKINEVLANARNSTNTDGTITDWVELYNPSNGSIDLSGMSLTDQLTTPRRWVFPAGSVIAAGGYRTIKLDPDAPAVTNAAAILNAGFGLKASGSSIYLFNRPQSGGELLDAVTFGIQAADWSIGRIPNGGSNWVLNIPSQGGANLVASTASATQLRINEWMAAPLSGEDDWFEIYNPAAQPVELSGLHLTDDLNDRLQYPPFPARSYIAAGLDGFLNIIADNDTAAGPDHVPFALSRNGESLGIVDRFGTIIDQVTFGGQFNGISQGRLPDGSTNIVLFTDTQSPEESNYLPIPNVVINEVLTHSDPPLEDAIELRNTTTSAVNIGGWYLSDARTALRKFRIPNGTSIPANGFRVFYETNFNPIPNDPGSFSLNSASGDQVYLSAADAGGQLTGYRAVVDFGAAANGVSFGRYITSALNGNKVDFTAMAQRTFGADNPPTLDDFRSGTGRTNSGPLVGPVVISEIMYHPPDLIGGVDDSTNEFVEIRNITGSAVPLFHAAYPTNTWRLKDAVSFQFPASLTIPANGTIVVVNFNPADAAALNAFRTKYNVQAGATILGPYSGKLANGSASVELARPDAPQLTGPDAGLVPYILVDKVKYSDVAPWPAGADGTGQSLNRITLANYGNDPINWTNAAPTPGPQARIRTRTAMAWTTRGKSPISAIQAATAPGISTMTA
ncbi:MAG: lamin tail domain-containing protein [Verrucomicrobia bacterium]|nr:lamin tail domain-containing protein [Verrucomicrobiota bacterium]